MRLSKKYFYMACVCMLMLGFTSCETDDSDVAELITGSTEGPGTEAPFTMEGTWVAGGMNMDVNMNILNNEIPMGETIEGMLLGLWNQSLPIKLESLSDLEIALKVESGTDVDKIKLSSPTIDMLVGNNNLALEFLKTAPFAVHSENGLANMLKQLPDQKLTLLNYVTDETPKGILISESPLAGLAAIVGEQMCPSTATLKSVFFSFNKATSSLDLNVQEENRIGKVEIKMSCALTIEVDGAFLLGIALKNKTVNATVSLQMDEWTALN